MKNKKIKSTVAVVAACAVLMSQFSAIPAYATYDGAMSAITSDGGSLVTPVGILGPASSFSIFASNGVEVTDTADSSTRAKICSGNYIRTKGNINFVGSGIRVIAYNDFIGTDALVKGGVLADSSTGRFVLVMTSNNVARYMDYAGDAGPYSERPEYIMVESDRLPVDVEGHMNTLATKSSAMAKVATPGTIVENDNGTLKLTYTGTESTVMFKLDKSLLTSASSIQVSVPSGATAIVSITGSGDFSIPTISTSTSASNLLINIPDGYLVSAANMPGSVLCPTTHLTAATAPMGQVVSNIYMGPIPGGGNGAATFNTYATAATSVQSVTATVYDAQGNVSKYVEVPLGSSTLQLYNLVDTTTYVPKVTVNGTEQNVTLSQTGYDVANLTNVTASSVVEIKATDTKFNMTLPTNQDGYTVSAAAGYSNQVSRGQSYRFQITPKTGYNLNNAVVKVNGQPATEVSSDANSKTFEIANVLSDYTITVTGVSENTHTVTIPTVPGYDITTDKDPSSVAEGDDLTLTITPKPGYSDDIVVKVDGKVITPNPDGTYTIPDITDDTTITIEGKEATSTVTIPTVPGYDITADKDTTNIPYGDNLTLTITPKPGYSKDIVVKANDTVITPNASGKYVITNITEDLTISIDGAQSKYEVTFPATQTGYSIVPTTPTKDLTYGASVSFKIVAANGYNASKAVVKANGVVLTPVNGEYTITSVTDNVAITVDGVVVSEYTVTNTVPQGVTFNSTEKDNIVSAGESYSFTLTIADGYDATNMIVKANGVVLTPVNGVYTIKDINSNQEIVVSNVAVKFLTVAYSTLPAGVTVTPGTTSTVEYGKPFTFTVQADAKYDVSKMIVTANNSVLKGTETTNNTMQYKIDAVKENQAILISGLTEKKYNVTVKDCVGATTILPSSTITAGSTLEFTVNVADGYDKKSLQVIVNNMLIRPSANGVYTVKDVSSDISIVTSGLSQSATYSINIPTVEGVKVTSTASNTVTAGGSYTFAITALEDYDISKMTVTANGVTLTPSNGTYTISNIQANQNVVISGVSKKKFTITSQALSGITISTSDSYVVEKGGSFTFKLLISSSIDPTTVSVKVNGIPLVGSNWTYTISNITENKDIVVTANNIVLNDSNSTTTKPDTNANGSGTNNDPYEKDDGKVIETGDDPLVNTALASTMGLSAVAALIAVFGKKFNLKKIFTKKK